MSSIVVGIPLRSAFLALMLALPIVGAHAQHGFVGLGTGLSRISAQGSTLERATRPSLVARAGLGSGPVQVVLDWQTHGLGDEQPFASDYQGGVTTRVPQVLRTGFLLLGLQLEARGFYLRPSLGVSSQSFAVYLVPNGIDAVAGEISSEGGLAAALSAGYRFRLADRLSLALELSALHSSGEDSSLPRSVLALQLIPLLDF
ncbi:MAG TPA: hypothetical protein VH680_18665 [Gemmatimonadales bacterium]|jgi:hypothetical protein